ncbi:MAG: pinensin family lanthipeptide [Rhodothermaceae bacterium]
MKKFKLQLEDLTVETFVTNEKKSKVGTIHGNHGWDSISCRVGGCGIGNVSGVCVDDPGTGGDGGGGGGNGSTLPCFVQPPSVDEYTCENNGCGPDPGVYTPLNQCYCTAGGQSGCPNTVLYC